MLYVGELLSCGHGVAPGLLRTLVLSKHCKERLHSLLAFRRACCRVKYRAEMGSPHDLFKTAR